LQDRTLGLRGDVFIRQLGVTIPARGCRSVASCTPQLPLPLRERYKVSHYKGRANAKAIEKDFPQIVETIVQQAAIGFGGLL